MEFRLPYSSHYRAAWCLPRATGMKLSGVHNGGIKPEWGMWTGKHRPTSRVSAKWVQWALTIDNSATSLYTNLMFYALLSSRRFVWIAPSGSMNKYTLPPQSTVGEWSSDWQKRTQSNGTSDRFGATQFATSPIWNNLVLNPCSWEFQPLLLIASVVVQCGNFTTEFNALIW